MRRHQPSNCVSRSFHNQPASDRKPGTASQFDTLFWNNKALDSTIPSTISLIKNSADSSDFFDARQSTMHHAAAPATADDERMDDRDSSASTKTSIFGGRKSMRLDIMRNSRCDFLAEMKRFVEYYDKAVKSKDVDEMEDADRMRPIVAKMAEDFLEHVRAT